MLSSEPSVPSAPWYFCGSFCHKPSARNRRRQRKQKVVQRHRSQPLDACIEEIGHRSRRRRQLDQRDHVDAAHVSDPARMLDARRGAARGRSRGRECTAGARSLIAGPDARPASGLAAFSRSNARCTTSPRRRRLAIVIVRSLVPEWPLMAGRRARRESGGSRATGAARSRARARKRIRARAAASTASTAQVCATIAASQPEASAFFTPADDSGSMNDPASPTSSQPSPAYSRARYWEASHPRGPSMSERAGDQAR